MEGADDLQGFTGDSCGLTDFPCHLSNLAEWLLNALLWVPKKFYEWFTDGLAGVLAELPAVPGATEFANNAAVLQSLAGVTWVLDLFLVAYGFTTCLAALLIRFGLRLTPFIA